MKVHSVYSTYPYLKHINFGERFKDENLKSNHYSDFISSSRAHISKLVLGEQFAKPMKFAGVGNDFDVHFDMYGVGKLHLLLMPNQDGINNFAKYYKEKKDSTLNSIAKVIEIVKKTNPDEDLYLFESGASERLKEVNKNGVVPAHLHFVTNKQDLSANIETINSYLSEIVGPNVKEYKNISMDFLLSTTSKLTKNGDYEYKFIAKKIGEDRFDAVLYYSEEIDKLAKPKSQVPSRVLSKIFYNADEPSYYNWKNIDADPKNWNPQIREKITRDRVENGKFIEKIISKKILLNEKTNNIIQSTWLYKNKKNIVRVGACLPPLILIIYIIKLNLSKKTREKYDRT